MIFVCVLRTHFHTSPSSANCFQWLFVRYSLRNLIFVFFMALGDYKKYNPDSGWCSNVVTCCCPLEIWRFLMLKSLYKSICNLIVRSLLPASFSFHELCSNGRFHYKYNIFINEACFVLVLFFFLFLWCICTIAFAQCMYRNHGENLLDIEFNSHSFR